MSEKQETQYRVTVQFPDGVSAEARNRAGIAVHREYGYVGPLTAEQLEAIEADQYLTVTNAADVDTSEADEQAAEVVKNAENQAEVIVAEAHTLADTVKAEAEAEAEAIKKAAQDEADKVAKDAKEAADATTKAAKEAGDKIIADAKAKNTNK